MVYARRRVSYIIPPPVESVPRLQLPSFGVSRLGSIGPLLLTSQIVVQDTEEDLKKRTSTRRPRHRLGVASLAIDTSTHLAGRNAPEGILYTGGRDGMVMSWDLAIPMKKRREKFGFPYDGDVQGVHGHRALGRWEMLTGWADEFVDEEAEEVDDRPGSDGDVLGDVSSGGSNRRKLPTRGNLPIPFEDEWETDLDAFKPGNPTQFRQSAQTHTDWVNDLLLCNYNQTVVSASSDGTVKAWNPHSPSPSDPSTIGSHSDYVRCLTHCREQNWLASGSFDRTIKLWDLSRPATPQPSTATPLMTLSPPDATAPKSSVYALAADPFGHTIASGSPERVIRLWDPRTGRRTGKLVGHTDNIRAILISEDSRYLLTGSTDASIKLWSLSSKRCLHTFTHHTDSVWSLFSSHPSLEIFYSGDKSGLVCKVDVENCTDVSEGECILLCQDSGGRSKASPEGINRIVVMDDNLLWTASSSSSVQRWRVPQRRTIRATALISDGDSDRLPVSESPVVTMFKRSMTNAPEVSTPPRSIYESITRPSTSASHGPPQDSFSLVPPDDTTLFGIPFHSLIRLTSPNDPFTPYTFAKGRDAEVATLYSAASIMSVPRTSTARSQQHGFHPSHHGPGKSLRADDTAPQINTARADYEERELAADAIPFCSAPEDVIEGDHGLVRSLILNDRIHALTVDTSGEVAVWDIVRAVCRGKYTPEEVASASHRGSTSGESGGESERSPREALEAVRERIEGEAVVLPWSSVDTKMGVLAIHLNERCFEAEIYADEVGFSHDRQFNDESRLNIGKWALRNVFWGFIREEQRSRRKREPNSGGNSPTTPRRDNLLNHVELNGKQPKKRSSSSSDISKRSARLHGSSVVVSSPKMIPAISPAVSPARISPLLTPTMTLHPLRKDPMTTLTPVLQSPAIVQTSSDTTQVTRPRLQQPIDGGQASASYVVPITHAKDADYFSVQTRQSGVAQTPDDFAGSKNDSNLAAQNATTPGGGLMGRLKNFGKISSNKKLPEVGPSAVSPGGLSIPEVPVVTEESLPTSGPALTKTPQQILLSGPLSFTPNAEAPLHNLPPNVSVIISEEASPGWTTVYRGTVASAAHDMRILEEVLPMWLLEYLLTNKTPPVPIVKLSFVLLPWPNKDPDGEQLPELLDVTQSKLTASRFLRVRKVIVHVQEKLDKLYRNPDKSPSAPRSSSSLDLSSQSEKSPRLRSEDLYEILCNDVLLPLDITLAAVKHFVWRQSGELVMYYRRRLTKGSRGL